MLENLPLHPAIVHLPMGIVFLLPIVTIFMAFLRFQGFVGRPALILLTFLHLVLVGTSYAALETGEEEEHKVERVIAESVIEKHEEKAEAFMIGTVVVFIMSLSILLPVANTLTKPIIGVLLVGQLVLLALGYRVGHSGGELVYVHGAAQAYVTDQNGSGAPPIKRDTKTDETHGDDD